MAEKVFQGESCKYRVVLTMYLDAGGKIDIWFEAEEADRDAAEKLPHIFSVSDDGEWAHLAEANYSYAANAQDAYDQVRSAGEALSLAWQAS